jgi:sec-independent protein translocase protein TatC
MSAKPAEAEEELAEGTLMSHLLELRSRLMRAVLAVIVVLVCLMPFMNRVFEYVSKPLREALPEGSEMIVTDVAMTLSFSWLALQARRRTRHRSSFW